MKRIVLIYLLFISFYRTECFSQSWYAQNSTTTQALLGVHFTDVNHGWAVGHNGTVDITTDGGTTWTVQFVDGNYFWSVFFVNSTLGWIVGTAGDIRKTTNGGANWIMQSSGTVEALKGVYFVDFNIGWAVGEYGKIFKTTNGGTNWAPQNSPTANHLGRVRFKNQNNGWVVGALGTIIKTTNGGTNWTSQNSGTTNGLFGNYFTDLNTGWASGAYGTILKTTNGGTNWIPQTSGTTSDLWGIFFLDSNTGWAFGTTGTIVHTTNGGTNWITQTSNTSEALVEGIFINANTGWAVGGPGTIMKYAIATISTSSISPLSYCQGSSFVLPFTTTGGFNAGNIFTAQISDASGNFGTPTSIGTLSSTSSGNINVSIPLSIAQGSGYRIRIVASNPSTLGTDNGTNLIINALPNPNISGKILVCAGSLQSYTAISSTGTNQWYTTGGTINGSSSSNTLNVTWGLGSTGSLRLVQTTTSGCKDSSSISIIINPLPTPSITGTINVCAESQQIYNSNSFAGSILWQATGGTINGSNTSNAVNVTWGLGSNGSLQLLQTTPEGCKDSSKIDVTINPLPQPTITGNSAVDEQNTEIYSSSKPSDINNKWIVSGGTIQGATDQQNVTIKWGAQGNGSVNLEQTNKNTFCSNKDSIIVKINSIGTYIVDAGADKAICEGNSIQIGNANPVSGGKSPFKYKWTPNTDLSNDAISNPSASPKLTTTYRLTVIDSRDSIRFGDVKITVNSLPIPKITGNITAISGVNDTYTATSPVGTDNIWSCIGGTAVGSQTAQSFVVDWQNQGVGKVILEQTITATACKKIDTLNVTVSAPGALSLSINGSASGCSGDQIQIGKPNPASGGIPPYKYKWIPNTDLRNDTIPNPIVNAIQSRIYKLTVTDSKNSNASADVNLTVNPLPSPSVIDTKKNPTAGETVMYTADFAVGTENKWLTPNGGQIVGADNLNDVQIKWTQTGAGQVYITQTITATGCKKSDSLSVNVLAPSTLMVFAGADREMCEQQTTQIGSLNPASGGKAPYKFNWSPSTGLSNDTLPNPDAAPLSSITYTVKVTDAQGDTANSKVVITVNSLPKPKIAGKSFVLLNAQETYSVSFVAGNAYKWIIENGSFVGKDTDPSINITWNQNKTGKVKIIQTSDKGCLGYDSISVSINSAGDCLSTTDLSIPECYIIPGYETVKLGTVKFKNICEENSKISKLEFQSKTGQFTIKDTTPDIISILKPLNDAEFIVAFKPKTAGQDEAFITIETEKGERKTSKITSVGVQGNEKTPLTVIKIVPSITKGKPGSAVNIEVRIIEAKNVAIKGSMAFITNMSWNSQVLQYSGYNEFNGRVNLNSIKPPKYGNNYYDFIIELEGNARTDNMQLAEIYTKALLGEYAQTDLIFREFKWVDTTIKAEILNDGIFELDLCKEDGLRMLKLSNKATLESITPNPVNESASIKYSLLEDGKTSLCIINTLGIQKKVLFDGEKKSGNYELIFSTDGLTTGIYYVVMQTQSEIIKQKLIIIK